MWVWERKVHNMNNNFGKRRTGYDNSANGEISPYGLNGLCKFVCQLSICKAYAEADCKCSSKSKKASSYNSKYDSLLWSKKEINFSM